MNLRIAKGKTVIRENHAETLYQEGIKKTSCEAVGLASMSRRNETSYQARESIYATMTAFSLV